MALALGLLGSQAGHLLAYQVRFGAAATRLQSTGAHAYFPSVFKVAVGTAAAIILAGAFIVGLARVLSRRGSSPHRAAPSLLRLLAALFTLQLAMFAVQETVEAALSGAPATPIPTLILWGTLGQLPAAMVAAMALRWLLVRLDGAVEDIRACLSIATPARLVPAVAPIGGFHAAAVELARAASYPVLRRGPPFAPLSRS